MNNEIQKPNADGLDIPAALRRETNARGVSLSAGVVATGAKTEPKTAKAAAAPKAPKKAKAAAAPKTAKVKAAKAAKPPKKAKAAKAPVIDPATGLPVEKVVRSIVPMKFKARYAKHNGTCGDDMANELKAATTKLNEDKRETLDTDALWAIAKQNKIDVTKYLELNNGQKRMNVGNKLRGLLNQGTDVRVGKRVFKAEDHTPKN